MHEFGEFREALMRKVQKGFIFKFGDDELTREGLIIK